MLLQRGADAKVDLLELLDERTDGAQMSESLCFEKNTQSASHAQPVICGDLTTIHFVHQEQVGAAIIGE